MQTLSSRFDSHHLQTLRYNRSQIRIAPRYGYWITPMQQKRACEPALYKGQHSLYSLLLLSSRNQYTINVLSRSPTYTSYNNKITLSTCSNKTQHNKRSEQKSQSKPVLSNLPISKLEKGSSTLADSQATQLKSNCFATCTRTRTERITESAV